jgi:hypothetical protein
MRALVAGIVLVGVALAIFAMREHLETRHEEMPEASRLVVDASAEVRGSQARAPSMARGLVASCVVEAADEAQVVRFTWLGHGRFRFVTRPALDDPDRRQLHGCLEDLRVPRLLVGVETMTVRPGAA